MHHRGGSPRRARKPVEGQDSLEARLVEMVVRNVEAPWTGADDIVGCEYERMPDCLYMSPRLASQASLEDLDGRIGPNFVGISLCRYTMVVDEEGKLLAVLWVDPSVDRMKVEIGQM